MGSPQKLSSRAIVGTYYRSQEERLRASWVPQICLPTSSDQESEEYAFLHEIPELREHLGPRQSTDPGSDSVVIPNIEYETGMTVRRRDLRRDKTGQILARTRDLGGRVASFPQKLVTDQIEANANAYDGVAFFGTHNVAGKPQISNAKTYAAASGTTPTIAEASEAILEAVQEILGATDAAGAPCNDSATEFLVMVPTVLWAAHAGALRNDYTGNGASNTLRAMEQDGLTIRLAVNPRLSVATDVFTWRTDANIPAGVLQEEFNEVAVLGEGSDYAVLNSAHYYGVTWSGGVKLIRYELANRTRYT